MNTKTSTAAAWTLLAILFVLPFSSSASEPGPSSKAQLSRPNIILILTDDQETGSLAFMPRLQELLVSKGTTLSNFLFNVSLCCPSRASILRGQYAHNHLVTTNKAPDGGFKRFRRLGHEESTIATWLQASGYRTVLIGKYMNQYPGTNRTYVPPGWDEWYAVIKGHYVNYELNENGEIVRYDSRPEDYETDVLSRKATDFIARVAGKSPFFIYLSPYAPHRPFIPAPRHRDAFSDLQAPRPPSFNEADVSDKPAWIRNISLFNSSQIEEIDESYRGRLRMLLAVDEMIEALVQALDAAGELDNTYLFFATDNGYQQGEHRLQLGKNTPYEESIRVPLIVRGPDVPKGRARQHMAVNIDLAPTFARLAGVTAPSFVDGVSLLPLLRDQPSPIAQWRQAAVVQHWQFEGTGGDIPEYRALRTPEYLYVEYSTGEIEFYDLQNDPHQLHSLHATADPALLEALSEQLRGLGDCAGADCFGNEPLPVQHTLTVNIAGSGSVTRDPSSPNGVYSAGVVVALTASPDPGWQFDGWGGDLGGSSNPASLTMDADKSITATFSRTDGGPPRYTLTTNTIGSGSIALQPGGGVYDSSTVVTLTANPDAGWQFVDWSGDLTGSSPATPVLMDSDKNVTATFVEQADDFASVVAHSLDFAAQQLRNSIAQVGNPRKYPRSTLADGSWKTVDARVWTSGFFPGLLWYMYERTSDESWRTHAESWTAGLENQKFNTGTHDVGFIIFSSFGQGYRLTGNPANRDVLLQAAKSLATRFNPTVGCIQSWESGPRGLFPVIVDNVMNLEILFWGAKNGGPQSWYDMAVSHTLRTGKDHVREDGSTFHIVDYNPDTGAIIRQGANQGVSDESTWARGNAWGLYGFAMAYRETGTLTFLQTAERIADFFIANLPDDYVPYWDFNAPNIPDEPKEASAAAIAASGLLELSTLVTDAAAEAKYRQAAHNILASLSSPAYLAEGTNSSGILLHSNSNVTKRKEVDVSLIHADHYFIEALLRFDPGSGGGDPTRHTLTLATTGAGTVTANPAPVNGGYVAGSVVTLQATPAPGWQFDSWSDDLSGSANPATLTMTSNKLVTANFVQAGGSGSTFTFFPAEDTRTKSNRPASNYGGSTELRLKARSPDQYSYLKFDLSGITGTVNKATLRLFCTEGSVSGGAVSAVSNLYSGSNSPWLESGLDWLNKPELAGPVLSSVAAVAAGNWVEFDVSAAVSGNGTVSFGLKNSSSDKAIYSSREGASPPELVLVTGATSATREVAASPLTAGNRTPLPSQFSLAPNYPNPFNPATSIQYGVPGLAGAGTHVVVEVFNVQGAKVRTLVDGFHAPGVYDVAWDGTDAAGVQVGSGNYIYLMRAGNSILSRTMTLLK